MFSQLIFSNDNWQHETSNILASDRGFLLGDGCFETLRCYFGEPHATELHWSRFLKTAEFLKIPMPVDFADFKNGIKKILQFNDLIDKHCWVRITLTRGRSDRGITLPKETKPVLLFHCGSIDPSPPSSKSLQISTWKRNERSLLSQHKCINYLEAILAKHEAEQAGFDDALFLNYQNKIACATTANIFIIHNKIIYTPSLDCGILPGVFRHTVISLAEELKIKTIETTLDLELLGNADEVFLTNSLIEIMPVHRINDLDFKTGEGTIAQTLLEIYQRGSMIFHLNTKS